MRSLVGAAFLLVVVTTVLTLPPTQPSKKRKVGGNHSSQKQLKTDYQIILREEKNINNITVHVGYMDNNQFKKLYSSCISSDRREVFYVEHKLNPSKPEACTRTTFRQDSFNKNIPLEVIYKKEEQKKHAVLGQYYRESSYFLIRGHLTAKADYGAKIDKDCTYYYINTAPQWQAFNIGNWKTLEGNIRKHFVKSVYDVIIYSGTHDVLKLSANNKMNEVYLDNGNQMKVPLYFYKVVYDKVSKNGTAFIGINNPFITNPKAHMFCPDVCENNAAFSWLTWKPTIVTKGYSFCCTIDSFRGTVARLPAFATKGLLV